MDEMSLDVLKAMQSCRCCLLRPPDKGLNTLYTHLGKTEIYSDMLKDCFSIQFTLEDNECGICEMCVTRLRDASDLKCQVQRSQARLEAALRVNDSKPFIKLERPTTPEMSNDGMIQCGVQNVPTVEVVIEKIESSEVATSEFSENKNASHSYQTCSKTFDDEAALATRMRVHAKQEITGEQTDKPIQIKCGICASLFKTKNNLIKHINVDHKNIEDKKYSCHLCQKEFKKKYRLNTHMHTHMGSERPRFACELCTMQFNQKSSLYKHMRMHKGTKLYYSCDICDKKLASKVTLSAHKRIHTGEKAYPQKPKSSYAQKTIFCEVCGKGFSSNSAFLIHTNTHKGVKPYSCSICNEQFTQKGSLKGHMHIHTGEKPYSCDICKKRFGLKSAVKNHMQVHQLEKTHACDMCNKQFKYKAAFVTHIKSVHSDQRPHTCDVCDKGFAILSSLKRHAMIHTGERPYVCDTCHKGFITKTKLKAHLLVHTRTH